MLLNELQQSQPAGLTSSIDRIRNTKDYKTAVRLLSNGDREKAKPVIRNIIERHIIPLVIPNSLLTVKEDFEAEEFTDQLKNIVVPAIKQNLKSRVGKFQDLFDLSTSVEQKSRRFLKHASHFTAAAALTDTAMRNIPLISDNVNAVIVIMVDVIVGTGASHMDQIHKLLKPLPVRSGLYLAIVIACSGYLNTMLQNDVLAKEIASNNTEIVKQHTINQTLASLENTEKLVDSLAQQLKHLKQTNKDKPYPEQDSDWAMYNISENVPGLLKLTKAFLKSLGEFEYLAGFIVSKESMSTEDVSKVVQISNRLLKNTPKVFKALEEFQEALYQNRMPKQTEAESLEVVKIIVDTISGMDKSVKLLRTAAISYWTDPEDQHKNFILHQQRLHIEEIRKQNEKIKTLLSS